MTVSKEPHLSNAFKAANTARMNINAVPAGSAMSKLLSLSHEVKHANPTESLSHDTCSANPNPTWESTRLPQSLTHSLAPSNTQPLQLTSTPKNTSYLPSKPQHESYTDSHKASYSALQHIEKKPKAEKAEHSGKFKVKFPFDKGFKEAPLSKNNVNPVSTDSDIQLTLVEDGKTISSRKSVKPESGRDFLKEKINYDLSRQAFDNNASWLSVDNDMSKTAVPDASSPNTSFHSLIAVSDSSGTESDDNLKAVSASQKSGKGVLPSTNEKLKKRLQANERNSTKEVDNPNTDLCWLPAVGTTNKTSKLDEQPDYEHTRKSQIDVEKTDDNSQEYEVSPSNSVELHNAGFVTLKSLLRTETKSPDFHAQEQLKPVMDPSSLTSPDTTAASKVNIKYMGALPTSMLNRDLTDMLKKISPQMNTKHSETSNESDPRRFPTEEKMNVDRGRHGSGDGKMDTGYRSESSVLSEEVKMEKESLYDSMASNASLGTKIRQYCRTNATKMTNEDCEKCTDSDNTLKDGSNSDTNLNNTVIYNASSLPPTMPPPNDSSPHRKRRKTKKQRDQVSPRKKKEEFIPKSSSEGSSVEDLEDSLRQEEAKRNIFQVGCFK